MKHRIRDLLAQKADLERQLEQARIEIEKIQAQCAHDWSYPIHVKSTEQTVTLKHPDPEMERSLSMGGHPPASFTSGKPAHWKRQCEICDLEQETTETKVTSTAPDFG